METILLSCKYYFLKQEYIKKKVYNHIKEDFVIKFLFIVVIQWDTTSLNLIIQKIKFKYTVLLIILLKILIGLSVSQVRYSNTKEAG